MPHGKGGSWIWPATRWSLYFRDGFKCVHCGVVVVAGATPLTMRSDTIRVRGWAPSFAGWSAQAACLDHPFPGAKVLECVTSCWSCNSGAGSRSRDVVAAPLTAYHRRVGRRLYQRHARRRRQAKEESRRAAMEEQL